jgi:integrase
MTLRDVLARLTDERVDVSGGFLLDLRAAVEWHAKANGEVSVSNLDASQIRAMMRLMVKSGRMARTVNNYRYNVLHLWRAARRYGWTTQPLPDKDQCPKLKVPQRAPTAWNPEEMKRLIQQCRGVRVRRGWGPYHWEALVSTIYDTSVRIGALMKCQRSSFQPNERRLHIPGEFHKSKRDTVHQLHQTTCDLLTTIWRPHGDNRLFPWPWHEDEIWRKFRAIVSSAGLSSTRRDMFHKIRRTSYTYVYVAHGMQAASEHASHTEDLSRFYLDTSFMPKPNPLDALPRIA